MLTTHIYLMVLGSRLVPVIFQIINFNTLLELNFIQLHFAFYPKPLGLSTIFINIERRYSLVEEIILMNVEKQLRIHIRDVF